MKESVEAARRKQSPGIREAYIVPYCHPDWAWTLSRRWHEKRYDLVINEVLDILKEHPEYRWHMDTYITEVEPFLRLSPTRYQELRTRIAEGKIGLCGSFTNLRPNMVGEETQIRDLVMGKSTYRALFPEADLSLHGGNVDVSFGHPQLPQLLRLAGYRYARGYRPFEALLQKGVPIEFHWEGLDGSTVLCSLAPYGGLLSALELRTQLQASLELQARYSTTGILSVNQGCDDSRPLVAGYTNRRVPLFAVVEEWNRTSDVPLSIATPQEFMRAVSKHKDAIRTIRGSIDPCEICFNVGFGGSHGLFFARHDNEITLTRAEKWMAIASLHGFPVEVKRLQDLWKEHLLTCAHATQWTFEDDYQELLSAASAVRRQAQEMKRKAQVFLMTAEKPYRDAEWFVFNELPFARREKIALTVTFPTGAETFRLTDGRDNAIPYQIDATREKEGEVLEHLVTAAVDMPAMGYDQIRVMPGRPRKRMRAIPFTATLRAHELKTVGFYSRRYRAPADSGFGRLRFHAVDTTAGTLHAGPVTDVVPAEWRTTDIVADGPLCTRYQSSGSVAGQAVQRLITVHHDEPRIDFRVEVLWQRADGFLTMEVPRLFPRNPVADVPFCVEEKNLADEPYGPIPGQRKQGEPARNVERQREGLFFAQSFVSCSDGKHGMTYCNRDATHYYLLTDDTVANVLHNSVTYRPGWERFINKAFMGEGTHTFTSHLLFHSGNWRRAHIKKKAQALLHPADAVYTKTAASRKQRGVARSFLHLTPDNLILTAMYHDHGWLIIRFYESEGKRTEAHLVLPRKAGSVKKINLEGIRLEQLQPAKSVHMSVRPWEIVTLKLRIPKHT